MMYVKINETTKTPHLFEGAQDLGELKKVTDKKSKVGYAYKLPENSLGRQWLKGNLAYDGYEITGIAPRTKGNNWQRYLSEEDKKILDELKQKAMKRHDEAKKPLTEEEKLERRIAKLIAQRDALRANNK